MLMDGSICLFSGYPQRPEPRPRSPAPVSERDDTLAHAQYWIHTRMRIGRGGAAALIVTASAATQYSTAAPEFAPLAVSWISSAVPLLLHLGSRFRDAASFCSITNLLSKRAQLAIWDFSVDAGRGDGSTSVLAASTVSCELLAFGSPPISPSLVRPLTSVSVVVVLRVPASAMRMRRRRRSSTLTSPTSTSRPSRDSRRRPSRSKWCGRDTRIVDRCGSASTKCWQIKQIQLNKKN
jgi:hypothetical protein